MANMKTRVTAIIDGERRDYYSTSDIEEVRSSIIGGFTLALSKYLITSGETVVLLRPELCPVIELEAIA